MSQSEGTIRITRATRIEAAPQPTAALLEVFGEALDLTPCALAA